MKSERLCKLASDLRSLPYRDLMAFAEVVQDEVRTHNRPIPEALLNAADTINPPAEAGTSKGHCPACTTAKGRCRSISCKWKD